MPLKKICRCGKLIPYEDQYCNSCAIKAQKQKAAHNKVYDIRYRNKDSSVIYHSESWKQLAEQCKQRFKAIDIYSYYVYQKIEFGYLSHHIETIENNKNRVYDLENLIYLTNENHNKIHSKYKKNYEETKQLLFQLIEKWKKEMNI